MNSDRYKVDSIVNTYAWIIATIVSSVRRIICIIRIVILIFTFIIFVVRFLIKVRIKCPAIIFAASRTDSVIGRILNLINSTHTMNGVIANGVPIGIRCAFSSLVLLKIGIIIDIIQMGNANLKVIAIWDVGVNV